MKRGGTTAIEICPQPVGVERPIAQERAKGNVLDQRRNAERVMALARQEHEAHQASSLVPAASVIAMSGLAFDLSTPHGRMLGSPDTFVQ